MKNIYRAVRTGSLNKAVCHSSFKGLIIAYILQYVTECKIMWNLFMALRTINFCTTRKLAQGRIFLSFIFFFENCLVSHVPLLFLCAHPTVLTLNIPRPLLFLSSQFIFTINISSNSTLYEVLKASLNMI